MILSVCVSHLGISETNQSVLDKFREVDSKMNTFEFTKLERLMQNYLILNS